MKKVLLLFGLLWLVASGLTAQNYFIVRSQTDTLYEIGDVLIVADRDSIWFWGELRMYEDATATASFQSRYDTKAAMTARLNSHINTAGQKIAMLNKEIQDAEAAKIAVTNSNLLDEKEPRE